MTESGRAPACDWGSQCRSLNQPVRIQIQSCGRYAPLAVCRCSLRALNRNVDALPFKKHPEASMMKTILAVVAALAVFTLPAEAASRKKVRTPAAQAQVACTSAGCLRVPPNCRPAPGRTFDGSPSGFDVMVCDRGSYSMYGAPFGLRY